MNTHLPSFIISETPNGVLYELGYLFTPGVAGGYSRKPLTGFYMDWDIFLPPALPGATRGNP